MPAWGPSRSAIKRAVERFLPSAVLMFYLYIASMTAPTYDSPDREGGGKIMENGKLKIENGGTRTTARSVSGGIICPPINRQAAVLICCQHASDQRELAKRHCAEAHKAMERHVPPSWPTHAAVLGKRFLDTHNYNIASMTAPTGREGAK